MALTVSDLRPGDKVRFREYDDMVEEYVGEFNVIIETGFIPGMSHLCGKVVTIKETDELSNRVWILEDNRHNYNAAMFELVDDAPDESVMDECGDFLAILLSQ